MRRIGLWRWKADPGGGLHGVVTWAILGGLLLGDLAGAAPALAARPPGRAPAGFHSAGTATATGLPATGTPTRTATAIRTATSSPTPAPATGTATPTATGATQPSPTAPPGTPTASPTAPPTVTAPAGVGSPTGWATPSSAATATAVATAAGTGTPTATPTGTPATATPTATPTGSAGTATSTPTPSPTATGGAGTPTPRAPTALPGATPPGPKAGDDLVVTRASGGTVRGADGRAAVVLGPNALARDARVSVKRVTAYPPPPASRRLVGGVYDFSAVEVASGARMRAFAGEVTLSFSYRPEELGRVAERTLALYHLDEASNSWQPVPSKLDRRGRVVTAAVAHFSVYSMQGGEAGLGDLPFGSPPNGDFDVPAYVAGTPPANPEFSLTATPVGTPPTNSDFSTAGYPVPTSTASPVPTNGDFENGLTGWVGVPAANVTLQEESGNHYVRLEPAGTAVPYLQSELFALPPDAQTIHFRASSAGGTFLVDLLDESDVQLTPQWTHAEGNWNDCRFDVSLRRDIPSWETDANMTTNDARATATPDPTAGPYGRLWRASTGDPRPSLTSSLFTLPEEAETFAFRAASAGSTFTVNLLDAQDQPILVPSPTPMGWADWRRQEIPLAGVPPQKRAAVKVRFTLEAATELYVDDVGVGYSSAVM